MSCAVVAHTGASVAPACAIGCVPHVTRTYLKLLASSMAINSPPNFQNRQRPGGHGSGVVHVAFRARGDKKERRRQFFREHAAGVRYGARFCSALVPLCSRACAAVGIAAPDGEKWAHKVMRLRQLSPAGAQPRWALRPVIVKSGDDCRQELMAVQIISKLLSVFVDSGLPLWLRPFEVRTACGQAWPGADA